jgi:hypothetical protein
MSEFKHIYNAIDNAMRHIQQAQECCSDAMHLDKDSCGAWKKQLKEVEKQLKGCYKGVEVKHKKASAQKQKKTASNDKRYVDNEKELEAWDKLQGFVDAKYTKVDELLEILGNIDKLEEVLQQVGPYEEIEKQIEEEKLKYKEIMKELSTEKLTKEESEDFNRISSRLKKIATNKKTNTKFTKTASLTAEQKSFIDKATAISEDSFEDEEKYTKVDFDSLVNEAKTLFANYEQDEEDYFEFEDGMYDDSTYYVLEFDSNNSHDPDAFGVIHFSIKKVPQF